MDLNGVEVVALAAPGFEELEFWYPVLRCREAGARVIVAGVDGVEVCSGRCDYPVIPDLALADYSGNPALVIVPSVNGSGPGYGEHVHEFLGKSAATGARVVAVGNAVATAFAAGVVDDGSVGGDAGVVVVHERLATAQGASQLPQLFAALLDGGAPLAGRTAAVLCENQYQELELWYPLLRLREAGATVYTVGPRAGAMFTSKLGYPVVSDLSAADVDVANFDVVVIPGGHSPEAMRRSTDIIDFVRAMDERDAIVAAICHAGWVLASAGIASGRMLTCVSIIRDDVIHAGGNYVNEEVVRDGNLITSRRPSDLPAFTAAVIAALEETAPSTPRNHTYGEPTSTPVYTARARFVPLAVGVASADYTQVSASVDS